MSPLKQVRFDHGNESKEAQFLTLPFAASVFATPPKIAHLGSGTFDSHDCQDRVTTAHYGA